MSILYTTEWDCNIACPALPCQALARSYLSLIGVQGGYFNETVFKCTFISY